MAISRSLAASLLCAFFLAGALGSRVDVGDMFMMDRFRVWQATHNRTYATAEERLRRFEIYRRNVEYIDATNRRGELTYELGENQFTDLTSQEFRARYTMPAWQERASRADLRQLITTRAGPVGEGRNRSYSDDGELEVPNSVDWRTMGAVTPVKSQSPCGCCWAFAAVASIEGLHKIKTGQLVSLSEQELVDCDNYDHGCNGGFPERAMRWVADNGGLTTESDYPFVAKKGECNRDKARKHAVKIAGAKMVYANSEAALELAVARQPVAVAIDSSSVNFQFYKGGVYSGPCGTNLDHAVTLIGYGADDKGRKYWIVRNSWGEWWGEKGYVRMARGVAAREGTCGIAMHSSYPVM